MVKATVGIRKATPADKGPGVIDLDDPNSADQLARELGVQSETSIGTGDGSETLPEPPESSLPAVTRDDIERTASGPATRPETGDEISGEFDKSDVKLPQFKIVNGSGELAQKFHQGAFIFADELIWRPPGLSAKGANPILHFVPLSLKKQFRENLTQDEVDEGLMPRIAGTKDEAREMGGTTEWVKNEDGTSEKPRWSPSGTCVMLIEEPAYQDREEDDRHPGFSFTLDGKNWAVGIYYCSGMAYREFITPIYNNSFTNLREQGRVMLHRRLWTLQVAQKKGKKATFAVFVPQIRLLRKDTGPELRDFVAEYLGSKKQEVPA